MRYALSQGNNSAFISSISYYELGKEIVTSLTLLRHMQQDNSMDWLKYHVTLEYFDQDAYKLSHYYKEQLFNWPEKTNTDPPESKPPTYGEDREFDEEDGVGDVALKLYESWYEEDEALLGALGRVITAVEQCLKADEQHSSRGVFDCIKSEQAFVESLQNESKRISELNAARLVALTNESRSDDDEEEERDEERWLRDATLPQWTKRNLESHLSFGWEMFGCKNSSVLSFVIDHIGLMTRLRDHMNNALKNVRGVTSPIERQQKFNSLWEEACQETKGV